MGTLSRRMGAAKSIALLAFVACLAGGLTAFPATAEEGPSQAEAETKTDVLIPTVAQQRAALDALPSLDHSPADAIKTDATARADGNVIDIAFVYPASLVTQADVGSLDALRQKFATAIAQTNQSYTNSGIPLQVRYVGDRQVASPTGPDVSTMLPQLAKPGDGVYDEAIALREETHADLVSLWVSGPAPRTYPCGIGYLGGLNDPIVDAEVAAWNANMFTGCVSTGLTFTHEVGHNLSAGHDAGASSPPSGKPYALGYTDAAHAFRTVMAYPDACTAAGVDCVRRPYYSSPTARTPEGWPLGNAGTDNTRAIAEQAPLVANYRQSQIYGAAPTITGTPRLGKTLSANTEGWAPGNLTFTYQWFANGAPITGATGASLKLTKAHLRTTITVSVTGSAPYYQPVALGSAATAPVSKKTFRKTRRPAIKGKARPGRVLRATMKRWKPAKKVRYKYKWYRSNKAKPVGTGKRYRLTRKDRGKKIWVKAIAYKKNYETTSRQSKKIRVRR